MTTCTCMYVHYIMQRIIQSVQYDRKQIYPDRILIDRYYIKLCTQGYTLHNFLQHEWNRNHSVTFNIAILFPCLYIVVNAMCTIKKCLCLDLFVIVVKLSTCSLFNLSRNIYFIGHRPVLQFNLLLLINRY